MKYNTWGILVCLCLLGGMVEGTWVDAPINMQKFTQSSTLLEGVEVNFCKEGSAKEVLWTAYLGQSKEICLDISNASDQEVVLDVQFVDGTFTNDQWHNRACSTNQDKDDFGRYVSGSMEIPISPKSITKHRAHILLPLDFQYTGTMVYGCMVYSVRSVTETGSLGVGLDVLVRKAKFINIYPKKVPLLETRYFLYILFGVLMSIFLGYGRLHIRRRHINKGK